MATRLSAGWPATTSAVGGRPNAKRAGISQPCSQSRGVPVGQVSWKGVGNHETLLPSELSWFNRPSRLGRVVYVAYPGWMVTTARCTLKSNPPVLSTWSMEKTYDELARRLLDVTRTLEPESKYIVGLAGPPGSGKSTVANEVKVRLNQLWKEERAITNEASDISVAVPMDGFHLYRWQLDAMQNPAEAHARRGAPWTFDAASLVDSLGSLRKKGFVSLPSFDHGLGDPVEDSIYVEDSHKIVIVEGNYLLLNDGVWNNLGGIFDERWFVHVDIDEAMRRIEKRHVLTGKPPEVAKWHVTYNDRPNAELIHETRWSADLLIESIPVTVTDLVRYGS